MAAQHQAQGTLLAHVAFFRMWPEVWSGKASQKMGNLYKIYMTDATGVAFEIQGTAKVAQKHRVGDSLGAWRSMSRRLKLA